jgi:hypothetical protein
VNFVILVVEMPSGAELSTISACATVKLHVVTSGPF